MIQMEAHPDGTILLVRVHAGAKRNELRRVQDGHLRVEVVQAPEKGKANKAIIVLLSKHLKLRKSQIELISGQTSREKKFLIHDITPEQLAEKIDEAIGNTPS